MSKRTLNRVLRRSALTLALGVCFHSTVSAQATSGSVFGQAQVGDVVLVENPATGFRREISAGSDGTYRAPALPSGTYRITVKRADGTTVVRDNVAVNVGNSTPVDFAAASAAGGGATALDTVSVIGLRGAAIDVSSVESTTILTAEQISRIPVPRDITQVALLAPGAIRGDAAFGNLASFGGASVAENQYYVNGFNITNSFAGLNFAQIPFEAIGEQQIKTGGYGAEFGRALGGVVNLTTKRGTNEFQAGANIFWTPQSLRSDEIDTYLQSGPNAGDLRADNSEDSEDVTTVAAWAGGALIKDRLFAYGLVQFERTETDAFGNVQAVTNASGRESSPTWLAKVDWNINDTNLLEFTAFSDESKKTNRIYRNVPGELERGDALGSVFTETGGTNYVLKYTGYLTDDFTLSALAGRGEFSRGTYLRTADGTRVAYAGDINTPATGCPIIVDARNLARRAITGDYSSTCNISGLALTREDAGDVRDQFRIDAEWALGDHLLQFGIDIDNFESKGGTSLEGGRQWRYATVAGGTTANPGPAYDIVREQIVNQGATVEVKQQAYYIQDNWSVTDNFIAYLGARLDKFENLNGDGDTYVEITDQIGPRLGFAWDAKGDSSLKVFGNAGRYALPLTPSVAIRGASASLFTREAFRFTGVDPVTGAPIGLSPTGRNQDRFTYINGEFGSPKDPRTIASTNLKPQYQDEYILGFEQKVTEHISVGLKGTFRDLKQAIDDTCDYRPFAAYAEENGLDLVLPNDSFPYCRLFNPGEDVITPVDVDGDGVLETVRVAGNLLSPKAERTYKAIELSFNGAWDNFFLQGSYTWSKNEGNTEGGVKSDIGQADTNVTQDFDYPELTDGTYGYLPNDRRHSLKLFGSYDFSEEWRAGFNVLVQSGRPRNCIGLDYYTADNPYGAAEGDPKPYGAAYFSCPSFTDSYGRGSFGRLPWTRQLDLSLSYSPSYIEGLQLKVDVFNVFNNDEVVSVSETGEDGTTGQGPLDTFLLPTSFQQPRTVRLMVQYDF